MQKYSELDIGRRVRLRHASEQLYNEAIVVERGGDSTCKFAWWLETSKRGIYTVNADMGHGFNVVSGEGGLDVIYLVSYGGRRLLVHNGTNAVRLTRGFRIEERPITDIDREEFDYVKNILDIGTK